MTLVVRFVGFLTVLMALAAHAEAAPIAEVEGNNFRTTAQLIPLNAFTLPVPGTAFSSPGFATATVFGRGGAGDVDIYAFTSNGGDVYFDIDDNPSTFDTTLSLFDSAGTLLAVGDDSAPPDPGSEDEIDSFLGVFTLPRAGTYYIAVTEWPHFPVGFSSATKSTPLLRPDGAPGGMALTGTPANDRFATNVPSDVRDGSRYRLHISVQNPATTSVPEPTGLTLFGVGLVGVAAHRRQRR